MPSKKQTGKQPKKQPEKILLETENKLLKQELKAERRRTKSMWRGNSVTIMVLIGALLIMALGVLERNRLIATIGGLGFLILIIKLLATSVMEDLEK